MHEPTQEPSKPTSPSVETVASIYDEVLAFNRENTGFAAGFKTMFNAILASSDILDEEQSASGTDTVKDTLAAEDQAEQLVSEIALAGDLQGDLVAWTSDGPMGEIGIRISAGDTFLAAQSTDGESERVSARALEPWLDSPGKFARFLANVEPQQVAEHKGIQKLTSDVVAGISRMVRKAYKKPENGHASAVDEQLVEVGESQLGAFASIAGEYERLGLDHTEEFKQVSAYVKRWGEGVLPEYLVAEEKAYLSVDAQGYGPSNWQRDPANLMERWDAAIEFCDGLLADPRTKSFGEEVRKKLLSSLQEAVSWSEQPENTEGKPYLSGVHTILAEVSRKFGNPTDDEEVFKDLAESFGAPSIDSQKNTLEQLRRRYYAEWQGAGILAKVVDQMHIDAGERTLTLERVLSRGLNGGPDTEEHFFRVNYADTATQDKKTSVRLSNSHIPVSRSVGGVREALGVFDESDADLVARQVAELLKMKETGVLPNLSGNLSSIIDPSTMISPKPRAE